MQFDSACPRIERWPKFTHIERSWLLTRTGVQLSPSPPRHLPQRRTSKGRLQPTARSLLQEIVTRVPWWARRVSTGEMDCEACLCRPDNDAKLDQTKNAKRKLATVIAFVKPAAFEPMALAA